MDNPNDKVTYWLCGWAQVARTWDEAGWTWIPAGNRNCCFTADSSSFAWHCSAQISFLLPPCFIFSALFATVDVTWAGPAATVGMDVSCFGNGILHAASTWDMIGSPPSRSDTYVLAKKQKNPGICSISSIFTCALASIQKPQGENRVNVSHPYCLNTSAWRKQSKCVERWSVSGGENRYLVSYTVAMQPLVSSVTLVSVRSCSDGYSCMHVCTQRHTHFPILASEIVTLSQTSCTPAFAYRLPPVFHLSFFQAQQERLGGSRPCQTRPPSPLAGANIKTASGS